MAHEIAALVALAGVAAVEMSLLLYELIRFRDGPGLVLREDAVKYQP